MAVFDDNGYLDSSGSTGEVLVGAGVWTGEQLEIVAIMGEDLSAFGGPILPGAVSGNPLSLKVWKNNQQEEFNVGYDISSGSGTFNELFSAISEIYFGDEISGCTDTEACNYDAEATLDDDSCEYAADNCLLYTSPSPRD